MLKRILQAPLNGINESLAHNHPEGIVVAAVISVKI
jgi:hypothetical protein